MKHTIHVLHVLNSAHGGSALSTFELIEALRHKGVSSSLLCFNNADEKLRDRINHLVEERAVFIPLYWMNKKIRAAWWKRPILETLSLWKTWGGYKYQGEISALIKRHGINIVHTSTILNPEGAIAAKLNRLPHVWHVRELIGEGTYFQFPFQQQWIRYVSSGASKLVANSNVTQQHLLSFFDSEKIVTIPNGIDVKKFSVKHHQGSDKLVVGMVGNVTSRLKNHEFFIRVAGHESLDGDVEFRIYGALPETADPYYLYLTGLIRDLKLGDRIKFMDYVMSPELIMKELDVLFHPTPNESFGRIFVEAMASGIPVIAVNMGGALEMVRHNENGFLIPLNDAEAAAERISELKRLPDLRNKMGERGRKIVEQNYTLDLLSQRMVALYNQLITDIPPTRYDRGTH